jgi:sigma-54 dependent transcriptional regulator, acetoin dehydrogenase operon transcriptional activator AcoR
MDRFLHPNVFDFESAYSSMKPAKFDLLLSQKENLERILENLSEGIIAHDRERRILFFNRSAVQITGFSREDVLGRDCHEVFGGAFCGGRCSFQDGCPESLEHLSYPLNIFTKEGAPRRIEMELTGMKDHSGQFAGVVAAFRDVTDLLGLRMQVGDLEGFAGIIGRDPKMLRIYRQIRDLAINDYPVHITGETGTGKELVANAIHNEGRRGGKPFVPVNCGALPEGILESELFGHVKGAFTGAIRDKKGRFELAHGGTLFLDEVADLPRPVQARLLRVLQEGTFERVGDEKTVSVNVRVISATNKDLRQEVARGNFREDLYYRVNVVPVVLPPLRERKGDIPLLVEYVLKRACEEGQETPGVSSDALSLLKIYPWPGNIRELQSALRFSLVQARGKVIQPDHLPEELRQCAGNPLPQFTGTKLDPETVRNALMQTGGNKKRAATLLGVGRATLYRFLGAHPNVS